MTLLSLNAKINSYQYAAPNVRDSSLFWNNETNSLLNPVIATRYIRGATISDYSFQYKIGNEIFDAVLVNDGSLDNHLIVESETNNIDVWIIDDEQSAKTIYKHYFDGEIETFSSENDLNRVLSKEYDKIWAVQDLSNNQHYYVADESGWIDPKFTTFTDESKVVQVLQDNEYARQKTAQWTASLFGILNLSATLLAGYDFCYQAYKLTRNAESNKSSNYQHQYSLTSWSAFAPALMAHQLTKLNQPFVHSSALLSTLLISVSAFSREVVGVNNNFVNSISDETLQIGLKGLGTTNDPYQITTCTELQSMSQNLTGHYTLMNDVDCSATKKWNGGAGFSPIGPYVGTSFTGSFNGNNYTVYNLYINRSSKIQCGLFGAVSDAVLRNIKLVNVDITGNTNVGGLVGIAYTDVHGSYVSNVFSSGTIRATAATVGGLIGRSGAYIEHSSSSAMIMGENAVGGALGTNLYHVLNCSATGNVVCKRSYAGGLTGYSNSWIKNSYATGKIGGNSIIGGLMGFNFGGKIINSYALGSVSGNDRIGGLVGNFYSGNVTNSYSVGLVTGATKLGGLIGYVTKPDISTIVSSYYDTNTSGKKDTGKGIPKTTSQMLQQATYEGWDFVHIWQIVENVSYPTLRDYFVNSTTSESTSETTFTTSTTSSASDSSNPSTSSSSLANTTAPTMQSSYTEATSSSVISSSTSETTFTTSTTSSASHSTNQTTNSNSLANTTAPTMQSSYTESTSSSITITSTNSQTDTGTCETAKVIIGVIAAFTLLGVITAMMLMFKKFCCHSLEQENNMRGDNRGNGNRGGAAQAPEGAAAADGQAAAAAPEGPVVAEIMRRRRQFETMIFASLDATRGIVDITSLGSDVLTAVSSLDLADDERRTFLAPTIMEGIYFISVVCWFCIVMCSPQRQGRTAEEIIFRTLNGIFSLLSGTMMLLGIVCNWNDLVFAGGVFTGFNIGFSRALGAAVNLIWDLRLPREPEDAAAVASVRLARQALPRGEEHDVGHRDDDADRVERAPLVPGNK